MAKTFWVGDVQSGIHDEQEIVLKGWVKRARGSNKIRFLVLRDSTGFIQCVAKKDIVGENIFEAITSALIETSVVIHGKVRVEERAPAVMKLIFQTSILLEKSTLKHRFRLQNQP